MALAELRLAGRVRSGEPLTGVLLRLPSEELLEMCCVAGMDFILIDAEHGPSDVVELRRHIALAAVHGVETIVRVGQDEAALVLRALDAGASGILAPHVDDAVTAAALVDACHYPPLGHRGFATYGRAGGFGTVSPTEHKARYAEGTLVLVMPESPSSADAAPELLAVNGVDGYMIGVADLAASSGPDDRAPADSCALIHEAGRAAGVARFDIVPDRAAADRARADGAQVVVYNLTAVIMTALAGLRDV